MVVLPPVARLVAAEDGRAGRGGSGVVVGPSAPALAGAPARARARPYNEVDQGGHPARPRKGGRGLSGAGAGPAGQSGHHLQGGVGGGERGGGGRGGPGPPGGG